MAIHNTVMYENVNKAMAKQKVALEVRNVVRFGDSLHSPNRSILR